MVGIGGLDGRVGFAVLSVALLSVRLVSDWICDGVVLFIGGSSLDVLVVDCVAVFGAGVVCCMRVVPILSSMSLLTLLILLTSLLLVSLLFAVGGFVCFLLFALLVLWFPFSFCFVVYHWAVAHDCCD